MSPIEENDSKEKRDYIVWPIVQNEGGDGWVNITIRATHYTIWDEKDCVGTVTFWDGEEAVAAFPFSSIIGWGRLDSIGNIDEPNETEIERVTGCVS